MNKKFNDKTSQTEKIIHIMVTTLCDRNCKYCCNKQYSLNDIPQVTEEELKNAHTICITGGEPFLFTKPETIAMYYKRNYPNIKKVFVYTNAIELAQYLMENDTPMKYIDGVNVSIKNNEDRCAYEDVIVNDERIKRMTDNWLYVFNGLFPTCFNGNFRIIDREWQVDFKPATDSIFRRV